MDTLILIWPRCQDGGALIFEEYDENSFEKQHLKNSSRRYTKLIERHITHFYTYIFRTRKKTILKESEFSAGHGREPIDVSISQRKPLSLV